MKYVSYINSLFKSAINKLDKFVVYGQNVSTGSCLGGLSRDFKKIQGCNVFDTPNTENTLVGLGFGLMISGMPSAFFMKQQDFLLLGIDHLKNTNNFIKQRQPKTSFSIVNIVMDAGFEGIQSSLNNLPDFCAIAGCEGYTISTKQEAETVIGNHFLRPGFRIISVSQRLFGEEILDLSCNKSLKNDSIIRYFEGTDLTIACFNFSLPQGQHLQEKLKKIGINASLYGVSAAHSISYRSIIEDAKKTNRLLIIDDSKCIASVINALEIEALRSGIGFIYAVKRSANEDLYRPHNDIFEIQFTDVCNKLKIREM